MRVEVAIIGTGKIGTDLLIKLLKTDYVKVVGFIGRRPLTKTIPEGVFYSPDGIEFFKKNPNICEVVFDCTDAASALVNAQVFADQGVTVIDLTPSNCGNICIPTVNCANIETEKNINMVTCGGQVSIPLLYYFSTRMNISYAEVVTQISADSAGIATRDNIDKYIDTTEKAILKLTNIPKCKVILNLNPLETTVMQTSLFIKGDVIKDLSDFDEKIRELQQYIPNYTVNISPAYIADGVLMTSVNILGKGDYISKYAGNLDVINCAAVRILNKIIQNCRYIQLP